MSLSAAEVGRWLRFGEKGGFGKATALFDRVAEGLDDLMFMKDDEITVLCRLADREGTYFGYCEGVIGRFNGTDVHFHSTEQLEGYPLYVPPSAAPSSSPGRVPIPKQQDVQGQQQREPGPAPAPATDVHFHSTEQLEQYPPYVPPSAAPSSPPGRVPVAKKLERLEQQDVHGQQQREPGPAPAPAPAQAQVPVARVIRQALSQPPTAPPGQRQINRLPLGPTIYGRTKSDLRLADGPVPINFSVDPPLSARTASRPSQARSLIPPPLEQSTTRPQTLRKEHRDTNRDSLKSFLTFTSQSQSYSSAASYYSCISKPGSTVPSLAEPSGAAYNASMAALDLATISLYSLASSRTVSTDYGLYYTRWALSQETISPETRQDWESVMSITRRRSWDSFRDHVN